MLNHRSNNVLKTDSNSKPDFGSSYFVTVYPVGAVVSAPSSGLTITVNNAHSFRAGDRFLRNPGTTNELSVVIDSVTYNSITFASTSYSVVTGDVLVNLGPDTGGAFPDYQSSPVAIYSDPGRATRISNATVLTDAQGNYKYYHLGDGRFWELVRDTQGNPLGVVQGFGLNPGRLNVIDFGVVGDSAVADSDRDAGVDIMVTNYNQTKFQPQFVGDYW